MARVRRAARKYLSTGEALFVDAYMQLSLDREPNATEKAAVKAGYVPRYGYNLLKLPRIQDALEKKRQALGKKRGINPEKVLDEVAKLAFMDLGRHMRIQPDGTLAWDFVDISDEEKSVIAELSTDFYTDGHGATARQVKKFKLKRHDKLAALDKLMRHFGLYKDTLHIEGNASMVERLQAGRKRIQKVSRDTTGDDE